MKHVPSWAQMVTRWPQLFLGCISRNRMSQRKEDGGQGGSIVHSQITYVMSFSRYPFVLRELNLDHMPILSPMKARAMVTLHEWFSKCSYKPAASASPGDLLEMPILRPNLRPVKSESQVGTVVCALTSSSVILIQVSSLISSNIWSRMDLGVY